MFVCPPSLLFARKMEEYNDVVAPEYLSKAVGQATHDEDYAIDWCMKVGLLKTTMLCRNCASPMHLKEGAEKKRWRCNKATCRNDISIKAGSFFFRKQVAHTQVGSHSVAVVQFRESRNHQASRQHQ